MRPVIQSAQLPLSADLREKLTDLHGVFEKTFQQLVSPPGPEPLARQARHLSQIYNNLSPENPYGRAELAEARLHFFMPTDIVKVWGPTAEVMPALLEGKSGHMDILDLGCGTGTASLGLAMMLAACGYHQEVRFTLVEPDSAVNRYLKSTMEALDRTRMVQSKRTIHQASIEEYLHSAKDQRFDLVVILNVLSEAFPEEAYVEGTYALVERLLKEKVKRNGFLIVVEPALKRFARKIAQVQQLCDERAHPPFAPCLATGGCPQTEQRETFCFHSAKVPMSPLVQSVAARSQLDRHEVNYSYLTLSPSKRGQYGEEPEPGETIGRIISFSKRVKKGFGYFVCTRDGIINAFAPRILPDGETKGGKLPHGTIVRIRQGR